MREKSPFVLPPETPYVPRIDRKKCTFCGTCYRTCVYQVFDLDQHRKTVRIDKDRCWSCGFCVGICPENAIVLVDRKTGSVPIWKGRGFAVPFGKK